MSCSMDLLKSGGRNTKIWKPNGGKISDRKKKRDSGLSRINKAK